MCIAINAVNHEKTNRSQMKHPANFSRHLRPSDGQGRVSSLAVLVLNVDLNFVKPKLTKFGQRQQQKNRIICFACNFSNSDTLLKKLPGFSFTLL